MPDFTIGDSSLLNVWGNSSSTVDVPTSAKIDLGWVDLEKPSPYFMNWIHNIQEQKINHILKHGIALWNSSTTYDSGDIVNYAGSHYISLTTNTNSAPSVSSTDWSPSSPSYVSSDTSVDIAVDSTKNEVDITLPSSNLINKFEDTNNIEWSEDSGKIKSSYVQKILDANRKDLIVTEDDNGSEIFANADNTNVNITLPLFSSLPDNWYVKLYVFDSLFSSYPDNLFSVNLIMQGSDILQRASGQYSSPYKIRSPNSVVYIRKIANSTTFFLEGVLRNSWSANCSYSNVNTPTEGGLTDVTLTEESDDRGASLNFNFFAGIIGDSTWDNNGVYYSKYFEVDFAPLNNLTDKYTTASIIRGFNCQPVIASTNFGSGRQYTAVTTCVSYVTILGTSGNYTNKIQLSVQSPINARTSDNVVLNVKLKFQNWGQR